MNIVPILENGKMSLRGLNCMLKVIQQVNGGIKFQTQFFSNSKAYVLKPMIPNLNMHQSQLENLLKYKLLGPTPELLIL